MAAPTGAFVMRNAEISFGATATYVNQVTKARLVPDTPIQTVRTLVPDGVVQDVDSAAWTLELEGIQDYTASTGLARYLFNNAGSTVTVTIEPKSGGVSASCSVVLVAPPFGGEQGEFAMIEVELPVVGQPTLTDPS